MKTIKMMDVGLLTALLTLGLGCAAKHKIAKTETVPEIKTAGTESDSGAAGTTLKETSLPGDLQSILPDVHFALNQYEINPKVLEELSQMAAFLAKHPDLHIIVEGHCCNLGSEEYNMVLGQKRADVVRDYFVSYGIDSSRLKAVSYGKERPLNDNRNEEERSVNRRAHFTLDTETEVPQNN
jgi:peptidoglycan-associated lipoprotein